MEDPAYTATVTVGGNGSSYRFDAFSKDIHSNQSFSLALTLQKPSGGGAFDISGSTATLYVTAYNNADYPETILASGVLSDSGSGTTDTVTFTVVKDLIPEDLGGFPQRNGGNSIFYGILSDADSVLELGEGVNVIDSQYGGTGTVAPGAGSIITQGNDLGNVVNITTTTPPTATLNTAYIVAAGATGAWSGQDDNLAIGNGADWLFTTPVDGNFVFDEDSNLQTRYNAGAWSVDADLVTSVHGRIGAVVSAAGDYTADQITNVPAGNIVAVEVQAAITELDGQDTTQQVTIDLNSAHRVTTSGNPHSVTASDVGNTTAQWNANQLLGKVIDSAAATPSNGDILSYNGSSGEWENGPAGGGGTSGRPAFECNFDTDVTASEPASGAVKFDNATPGSATTIRCSTTDVNGITITNQLSSVGSGDAFIVYQINDTTKFLYFLVTSSTLVTTSSDIVGTSISGGVALDNVAACGVAAYVLTSGGASGVASFNGRTGGVIPAIGDYTGAQVTDTSGVGGTYVSDSLDILNNTISPTGVASGTDNDQTGTTYTLVLTDQENKTVWMNNALPNTVTIPTNASVAFDVGNKIAIMMEGVGVTTVQGDTGVTLNGTSGGSIVINNQYQGVTLTKRAADTWIATGDLT
jgi:hypothetical protein